MPWKTVTSMEEILRFVLLAKSGRFTITELCEAFGISRKTGYKHLERYAEAGLKGLGPRSHRPHRFPHRTEEGLEALILAERKQHRTWGPKKLHRVLQVKHGIEAPARTLTQSCLARPPLRRRHAPRMTGGLSQRDANFGWISAGDSARYPAFRDARVAQW